MFFTTRRHGRSAAIAAFTASLLVGVSAGITQVAVASNTGSSGVVTTLPQELGTAPLSTLDVTVTGNPAIPATTGGTATVTVTFANPDPSANATIDAYDVTIDPALEYQAGTATVDTVTQSDPTIDPGTPNLLMFRTPVTVPAAVSGTPGTVTVTFEVFKNAGTSGDFAVNVIGATGNERVGPVTGHVTAAAAPTVFPVAVTTGKNGTILITPNTTAGTGTTIDSSATCVINPDTTNCETSVTTGAGTFAVETTGEIEYVAANGFVGTATIGYRVTDMLGQTGTALATIDVYAGPTVTALDRAAPYQGTVRFLPTATPATGRVMDYSKTCLFTGDPAGCTNTVTLDGKGTFVYDPDTRMVTFTAANGYVGDARVNVSMSDDLGTVGTNTITARVGAVSLATATAQPVTDEMSNTGLTPTPAAIPLTQGVDYTVTGTATICLSELPGGMPTCYASGNTLVNTAGSWTWNDITNEITFIPVAGYVGTAEIYYQVTDSSDATTAEATVSVLTYGHPTTTDLSTSMASNTTTSNALTPVGATNPSGGSNSIDATATCLLDSATSTTCATTATVTTTGGGTGTFSYDALLNEITFTPSQPAQAGVYMAWYRVTDTFGANSVPDAGIANLTVNVVGPPNAPAINGSIVNTQTFTTAVNASANIPATINVGATCVHQTLNSTCTSSLAITNEGTLAFVNTGSGLGDITFTPVSGFVGVTSAFYTVTDSLGNTTSGAITINVTAPVTPVSITTATTLTTGALTTAYSAQLAAANGQAPYTWTITSGALPSGLTLDTTGLIHGTPTQTGVFNPTIMVTDSQSTPSTASATFSLTVNTSSSTTLAVSTTTLTTGAINTAYSATLAATGGTAPYTWALQSGSVLPTGLALSTAGVITGTPTIAATTSFTVVVTDSVAATATRALSLTVATSTGLTITPATLTAGTVGLAYSQTLTTSGGSAPYTWTITSGTLPAGLTLSTGGVISGTPTLAGSSSFTVRVGDSSTSQLSGTLAYTLTIQAAGSGSGSAGSGGSSTGTTPITPDLNGSGTTVLPDGTVVYGDGSIGTSSANTAMLPKTGGNVLPPFLAGLSLLLAGLGLVFWMRSRHA